MERRRTRRMRSMRMLRALLPGVVVALGALTVVATGGASAAAGGGRVPHLEVHGKAILVQVDPLTDVATRVTEGSIHISASDTCPPQTSEQPDCVDRMSISFNGQHPPDHGDGYFVQVGSDPNFPNAMSLSGIEITFVDGGEPGTVPAGPPFPGGAGIAPTRDYARYGATPTAAQYRWYFLTGGIQVTGIG